MVFIISSCSSPFTAQALLAHHLPWEPGLAAETIWGWRRVLRFKKELKQVFALASPSSPSLPPLAPQSAPKPFSIPSWACSTNESCCRGQRLLHRQIPMQERGITLVSMSNNFLCEVPSDMLRYHDISTGNFGIRTYLRILVYEKKKVITSYVFYESERPL